MRQLHERLGDIYDTTKAVAKHMVDTAALERTNVQRAAEGKILCDLMEVMTGVDEPADKAADAICQIFHHCYAEGLDIDAVFTAALGNFEAEVLEEMNAEETT